MATTLIIGGTGSLGRKLIERYLNEISDTWESPGTHVVVFSRDEAKHSTIRNELSQHPRFKHLAFDVGDVRDYARIKDVVNHRRPETIIIAAALKQVDTCELTPSESVQTNLIGTQNVVNAVNDCASPPQKVLFVSTDKACSPVNVYGMCKAISERIVTSQGERSDRTGVKYLAVRYGNVLESRGSIIPLFKWQGEHNDALTVTDPDMTRFLMTLNDSVNLIKYALHYGVSGDIWIPRLPSMRIGDLAEIFSHKYDKRIKIIGLRPGEKQHEDLINASESVRVRVKMDTANHYVIGPANRVGTHAPFTYSSNDSVMTKDELEQHLKDLKILDAPSTAFKGTTIEEIVTNRQ